MKKCKKEYEKKGKEERASGTRERDAENTRRERERGGGPQMTDLPVN